MLKIFLFFCFLILETVSPLFAQNRAQQLAARLRKEAELL